MESTVILFGDFIDESDDTIDITFGNFTLDEIQSIDENVTLQDSEPDPTEDKTTYQDDKSCTSNKKLCKETNGEIENTQNEQNEVEVVQLQNPQEAKESETPKVQKFSWAAVARDNENAKPASTDSSLVEGNQNYVLLRLCGNGIEELKATPLLSSLMSRGLINTGNSCFRSVVFQSLLSCKLLVRALVPLIPALLSAPERFPVWSQFAGLVKQFEMPTLGEKQAQASRRKVFPGGQPAAVNPEPFIGRLCQDFRTTGMTSQEDAQEFLDYLLNHLHEEILKASKTQEGLAEKSDLGPTATDSRNETVEEQDGWCEVAKGGNTAVYNNATVDPDHHKTLVSQLFHGAFRSDLKKTGTSQISVTLQPFQCIQLDIRNQSIRRIEDALEAFFKAEEIEGLKSNTDTKVTATKQYSFENLPPILILHLKRFWFDSAQGTTKLSKGIGFPSQLQIPNHFLCPKLKNLSHSDSSNGLSPISYNLFSVIYHHGQHVSSGHYTCFCADDMGNWRYFDDQIMSPASLNDAMNFRDGSSYLLFYERLS